MSGSYAKKHNYQPIRFADIKNFQSEKNMDKLRSIFDSADLNGNFDSDRSSVFDHDFRLCRFEFISAFNFYEDHSDGFQFIVCSCNEIHFTKKRYFSLYHWKI